MFGTRGSRSKLVLVSGLAMIAWALGASAQTPDHAPVATATVQPTSLQWTSHVPHAVGRMVVSGPEGLLVERTLEAGESLMFRLDELGPEVPDGSYGWELRLAPQPVDERTREEHQEARDQGIDPTPELRRQGRIPARVWVESGSFSVKDGVILNPSEEETAGTEPPTAIRESGTGDSVTAITAADQVILDDLIVGGSLCVGVDCVDGENFGFDTIRTKENNLRIDFTDTSSSSSFPTEDWQLVANESANGGLNAFWIQADGPSGSGDRVFLVEAGAPTNALYVESDGDIGLGTSNPVVDIHDVTGNTPTLRLDQDGSSGFTPQVWDIAGNESNFFVRDVTGGAKLPFRIRPGAPTSSIDVSANGDVGIGTARPGSALHLSRDGSVTLTLEDRKAERSWAISTEGDVLGLGPLATASASLPFQLRESGDLVIHGAVAQASSRAMKEDLAPVDVKGILKRLVDLPLATWRYTRVDENPARHLGPMAEDFHEAFQVGEDPASISILDATGVALAAIQGLHRELVERDERIERLEEDNRELAERLAALEEKVEDGGQ